MPLEASSFPRLSTVSTVVGLLALSVAGIDVLEGWLGQSLGRRDLKVQAASRPEAQASGVKRRVSPGDALATLKIGRFEYSVVVLEGSNDVVLKRGPGHIEETAYPGESGNIAIAGHRDTHFRILKGIQINDVITLTTGNRIQTFHVDSTQIIVPTEMSILDPTPGPALTLVTCYPFEFIGNAPLRFIVRATPRESPAQSKR